MAFNSIGVLGYTPPGLAFNAGKAILGSVGIGGMGGGGGNFDDAFYRQRTGEIDAFARELAAQRQNYKTKLEQLQSNAFNRFVPDYEAKLAGRGLQVSGGAYASGLGRESAQLQGQLEEALASREQQDAYKVQDLKSAIYGQWGAADTQAQMARISRGNAQQDALMSGLGNFAGQVALNAFMPGAGTAASAASAATGSGPYSRYAFAARPTTYGGYGKLGLRP